MNIEEYFNNCFRGLKDPSLKVMKYFMDLYNNIDNKLNFIHIAGTNGKGSTVEMINTILIKEGYKVGKFLSPHLIKYNERISINNINIKDKELEELIIELNPKIKEFETKYNQKVTFFELITIISIIYFYRNKVDFVVFETGLGGTYDCTNIIKKPICSIITSIGYDHMNILGNTKEEIATNKAGIIKENSNTIIFDSEENINNIFINKCKELNNKLIIVNKNNYSNYSYDNNYQYFNYKNYKNIKLVLKGKVQINNAGLTIECINILKEKGFNIKDESIYYGLENVIHHARMEELYNNPKILYDGAHNEPAINNLNEMINMYYKNKNITFIISILKRKDYNTMLKLLSKNKNALFILTNGNNNKEFTENTELLKCALNYINKDKIKLMELKDTVNYIKQNKDNIYFYVGSFYIYGDIKKELEN